MKNESAWHTIWSGNSNIISPATLFSVRILVAPPWNINFTDELDSGLQHGDNAFPILERFVYTKQNIHKYTYNINKCVCIWMDTSWGIDLEKVCDCLRYKEGSVVSNGGFEINPWCYRNYTQLFIKLILTFNKLFDLINLLFVWNVTQLTCSSNWS